MLTKGRAGITGFILTILLMGCTVKEQGEVLVPEADYSLGSDQTHNRWSSAIEPVIRVDPGSVIDVRTEEASDAQLNIHSTKEDLNSISFDPIHPLTGPVYVNGAEPGDVLKVKLHKMDCHRTGIWFPGR